MQDDRTYMQRALALAALARGRTTPNPMVGCVMVRDGVVVAEGYHARAGAAHAEAAAAANAKAPLAGAAVYVNLEPCAHVGRTPPCVDLLIREGVARVVVAMVDPNPKVSGRGIARLREAGIAVEVGLMEAEARRLNEAFVKFITTGRPFVVAKCAMTMDGKIATRTGHSRWVTGPVARRRVHELRNQVDAILVGAGTVLADDPSLTTRLAGAAGVKHPLRVVVTGQRLLVGSHRVFERGEGSSPVWVVIPEGGDRDAYAQADAVLEAPAGPGGVDLDALMAMLGQRGIMSLLIEGGGQVMASALASGVVDKLWFFVAPKVVGGRNAPTPVEGEGVGTMDEALVLHRMQAYAVDGDVLLEAYTAAE